MDSWILAGLIVFAFYTFKRDEKIQGKIDEIEESLSEIKMIGHKFEKLYGLAKDDAQDP